MAKERLLKLPPNTIGIHTNLGDTFETQIQILDENSSFTITRKLKPTTTFENIMSLLIQDLSLIHI